jgi:hypothetical protein
VSWRSQAGTSKPAQAHASRVSGYIVAIWLGYSSDDSKAAFAMVAEADEVDVLGILVNESHLAPPQTAERTDCSDR